MSLTVISFFRPNRVAFSATPTAFFTFSYVRVFFCKFMTMLTLRGLSANTSTRVFARGNGFQMIWINAISNATKMIDLQAFRDLAFRPFVTYSMSGNRFLPYSKAPVTFPKASFPKPALFLHYFFPESGFNGSLSAHNGAGVTLNKVRGQV